MDLRDATRLLKRRIRLIVSVAILCTVAALLTAFLITPQYRAQTVVMVDSRKTQVLGIGAVVSGLPTENAALRSEIDIITSRAVVDRVVRKLNLVEDSEFQPREGLGLLNPFRWFRDKKSDEEQQAFVRSAVAQAVTKRLQVINDGRSYSIMVMFDSKDPRKAAQIANAFADEYLVDQLEAKYETTSRATKWLDERLGALKKQVEESERAVESFREKSKLIEIDGATVAARQLDDINRQLTAARGETSKAEARLRSAQDMVESKDGVEGAADVLASPLIQRLREQEAEVRSRQAELATRYGALHPKMINAQAEYRELQRKIAEEVRKIVQGLANEVEIARAKEKQLAKDLQDLESRAGVEMKDSVALRQLKREAEANRALYESFLTRFKQTSEQEDLQVADSRIIARADAPTKPVYPNKLLFLMVGGILGAILGVLLAYLVEYFDRGFRSAEQVEEAAGLPVVGLIPNLAETTSTLPEEYVVEKPLSAYSEALRTVRTAIHFSNVDKPPRSVMVTSAAPGEGKTTFCLSLARSIAKAGNKVLLIDADLRRPRLAKASGLAETRGGLAALLAGERSFAEVMQPDRLAPGLDLIPATSKAPNAQDLLGSQQMRKMIEEASRHYDLVIVDTPPILAVSDAAMVARAVDTTIFLVHWAVTPRTTALQAIKQLHHFGCRVAGVALTQVNPSKYAEYGDGYHQYNYNAYYAN